MVASLIRVWKNFCKTTATLLRIPGRIRVPPEVLAERKERLKRIEGLCWQHFRQPIPAPERQRAVPWRSAEELRSQPVCR